MGSLAESSSLQTSKMMKSIVSEIYIILLFNLIYFHRNFSHYFIFLQAVVALCMFAAAAGEAEASADAGVLYGHYGYGHHLAHHGYYGYPYAHHYGHYYGKRSADAEPEAAADAGIHYGAYGYYGHPYHYGYAHHGYYGYPYAHRGYYGYHH